MAHGEQRIEPLNDGELKWIETNLRLSSSFVKLYGGCGPPEGILLAEFDALYVHDRVEVPAPPALDGAWNAWLSQWQSTPAETREDPNPILNAVGVALGQELVGALGLRWVIVTDQHGTEVAVHGDPGDILIFPPSLVGKRFANRAKGFIMALFE